MNFLQIIEADAVMAWDDFLKGITYLSTEAAALIKWCEGKDPAIVSQVQQLLTLGETAAAALVAKGNPALTNIIVDGVDLAEQGAANLIQSATGNSATGVTATALATAGLSDLGSIATNMATLGYTKAVAALAQAAAPVTNQSAPGATGQAVQQPA